MLFGINNKLTSECNFGMDFIETETIWESKADKGIKYGTMRCSKRNSAMIAKKEHAVSSFYSWIFNFKICSWIY